MRRKRTSDVTLPSMMCVCVCVCVVDMCSVVVMYSN